jgi:hypothetical protein
MEDFATWTAGRDLDDAWRAPRDYVRAEPQMASYDFAHLRATAQAATAITQQDIETVLGWIEDYQMQHHKAPEFPEKGKDFLGNKIDKIYIKTDCFVIYSIDDKSDTSDTPGLRYVLPDDYDTARRLRAKLMPVASVIAYVSDMVAGMRPLHHGLPLLRSRTYDSLRERSFELMARAMGFAFEGHAQEARTILDRVTTEIETRRDSQNRMRYVLANLLGLGILAAVGYGVAWDGPMKTALDFNVSASATQAVRVVDTLLMGALGAFFSVSLDVRSVKVGHTITLTEMIYAGFVRIPIGVIAAGVAILLIRGGWILGSVDDALAHWSMYLFGFLAGFSEYFVPNALKKIGDETEAKAPTAPAAAAAKP